MNKHKTAVLLFICVALGYTAHVSRVYEQYTFAHYDPGWQMWATASLVKDGDLDLRNQLEFNPVGAQDQTARGKNGEWYPLHEYLMPMTAIGFYAVFGINGCLYYNLLVSILMIVVIYYIAARHVSPPAAFASSVLVAFPSLFTEYSYSYSVDVFGAFLLLISYWAAVERKYLSSGAMFGLAVMGRLANVFCFPAFVLFFLLPRTGSLSMGENNSQGETWFKRLFLFGLGGFPLALLFMYGNYAMFGSPFDTAYNHWQRYENGTLVMVTETHSFDGDLLAGLARTLFDRVNGFFVGIPMAVVALVIGMRPFWRKARNEAIFFLALATTLCVIYSRYTLAFPGSYGNRYLMIVAALSVVPLAYVFKDCFGEDASLAQEQKDRGE